MGKKGLAVIYDPHNLFQFVWYFCNENSKKKWDALCLPNGKMGEYMGDFCEKASIFEQIFRYNISYENMKFIKKICIFSNMFLFAILKKQEKMCYKIVEKYVNPDLYDEIVILTDSGIVSGACMGLAEKKKVVILEDGVSDTLQRHDNFQWKDLLKTYHLQGYILSKMGYACPGHHYVLKTSYNCIKYYSNSDIMPFKGYKEIRQLFDMKNVDENKYNQILKKVYPQLENLTFRDYDAIIFTSPINDYTDESDKYVKRICEYLGKKYCSIMVKKHPRDKTEFNFDENKKICNVSQTIPAELLFPFLANIDIYFMSYTTMAMYLKPYDYMISYFYLNGLYEESKKKNTAGEYYTEEEMENFYYYWIGKNSVKIVI